MIRQMALIAFAGLLVPAAVSAQSSAAEAVGRARANGIVGERFDGYLGLVREEGPLLHQQVNAINIRRRALYAELSDRRGVSVQEVGLTAACQLLGTVGFGERYLLSDNIWRIRAPGQQVPRPDYCR